MVSAPYVCLHPQPDEYVIELVAQDVDAERVTASLHEGMVQIHVPRMPPDGRRIHLLHPEAEAV